jgi:hypothetical protein
MKTELKFAIIYVVISFLWNCLEYFAGLQDKYIDIHPYVVTPFYLLLTVIIYYLNIREKRWRNYRRISFIQAFGSGVLLSILIIILNPFLLYIFGKFINPEFYNSFIQYEILSGKMTPNEAADYYNIANFIVRGSIYRLVMGITVTLIIAVFIRKTK